MKHLTFVAGIILATVHFARGDPLVLQGSATIAVHGDCHPTHITFTSESEIAASVATTNPLLTPNASTTTARDHMACVHNTKRLCNKKWTKRYCSTADAANIPICNDCKSASTLCEKPPPWEGITVEETVTAKVTFTPLDPPTAHQWLCTLEITEASGKEIFSGGCDSPSRFPMFDDAHNVYALPMRVFDTSSNNPGNIPAGYGSFQGSLVVTPKLFGNPDTATNEDLLGITGVFIYNVNALWLGDALFLSPWQPNQYTSPGAACIYTGRLDMGDVSQYWPQ
jgi:hypothetical protein